MPVRRTQRKPYRLALALFAGAWSMLAARLAPAHEGPPFPILMDQPAAGYGVSVWADPDVGKATFYVILETPEGKLPAQEPLVTLSVAPVSGRLQRVAYSGERQRLANRMQFVFNPEFDQRDMWTVDVRLQSAGGMAGELAAQVESTPPGLGAWDLAVYLFPFLLLGGLWAYGMFRHRRATIAQRAVSDDPAITRIANDQTALLKQASFDAE